MKINLRHAAATIRKSDDPPNGDILHSKLKLMAGMERKPRRQFEDAQSNVDADTLDLAPVLPLNLNLLRRQRWTIASIVLLGCAITAAVILTSTARYTASTLLMLDQRGARLLEPGASNAAVNALATASEIEILRSDSVALKVVKQLRLDLVPEFKPEPGLVSHLLKNIGYLVQGDTLDTPNPQADDSSNGHSSAPYALGPSKSSDLTPSNKPPSSAEDEGQQLEPYNAARRKLQSKAEQIARTKTTALGQLPRSGVQVPEPAEKNLISALGTLKASVNIRRSGGSDVIVVEATSLDPQRAAQIANAYAYAYLGDQISAKIASIDQAEQALTKRIQDMNDELRRSEAQVSLRQVYQDSLVRLKSLSQQRDTVSPDARIVSAALAPRQSELSE